MNDQPFSRLYQQAKYTSSCSECGKSIPAGTPLRWTPQEDAHGRRKGPPLTEHPACYDARLARAAAEWEANRVAQQERIDALLKEHPEWRSKWTPDPERGIHKMRAIARNR